MPHKDPAKAKEYFRKYYLAHAEKKKKQARLWAKNNPKRLKELGSKRSAKWAKNNPERIAEIQRKHEYGINPAEYDFKRKKQRNRCAICGKRENQTDHRSGKIRALSVDHDHVTNVVRGLLCGNCNRGLGLFQDSLSLLLKAVKYLKKYKRV